MGPEKTCQCAYHRFDVVHIVEGSEEVYDHSQDTWDKHLRSVDAKKIRTFPSCLWRHGASATELRVVVLQAMAVDMYKLIREVHKWLTTQDYKPENDGKGWPADWLRDILRKADGQTSVHKG